MQGGNNESALKQLYAKRKGVIGIKPINNPLVPSFQLWGMHESATRKDQSKRHTDYGAWERDAIRLGYHIQHHVGVRPPEGANWTQAKWSTAHKVNKLPGKGNTYRGSFSHQGHGEPHGYLKYKYMPEEKQIKPIKTKKEQSNIKNQIDALAGQPTGHHSSISPGESV